MTKQRLTPKEAEDKKNWAPGPWQDEPDSKEWTDEDTGFKCAIRRGPVGAWCGYVGVPTDHPAFGLSYNGPEGIWDLDDNTKWWRKHVNRLPDYWIYDINVHGGLTYAKEGKDSKDRTYWFGFDCAHAGDICPKLDAIIERPPPYSHGDVYRDIDYVTEQVKSLAKQLAAIPCKEKNSLIG